MLNHEEEFKVDIDNDGFINKSFNENLKNYNFHKLYKDLLNFCTLDLSSFYFDIRKDCLLYTSPSPRDRQKSRMPSSA